MARFTDEELTKIKQDISLIRIMEAQGHQFKKHGKDYVCTCPFHDDKTPSLIVTPTTNLWHCMGACQTGGSVIDWVMKSQGVSFRYAVESLKKDHLDIAANTPEICDGAAPVVKKNTTRILSTSLVADLLAADNGEALALVNDHYHAALLESSDALDYLEKRGLNHPELINTFKLGYANRTLAYHLPQNNRVDGAKVRAKLKDIGILRDSGHEHLNGSITVPVLDESDHVVEMYGRKIRDGLRQGTAYHLYLPGPHAGVWNQKSLKNQPEIILCESLIDAMTFWVNGFKHVTTSYGTAGFTPDHLAAFKTAGVERVLIAYDRDDAGNYAAEQLAMALRKEGIESFRILFPKGMDANEYALNMKPASKALEMVIRKAEWMCIGDTKRCGAPERNLNKLGELNHPVEPPAKTKTAAKEKTAKNPVKASVSALIDDAEAATSFLAAELEALEINGELSETTLPASPLPAAMTEEIPCQITDHEIMLDLGGRAYRVRGFKKNMSYDHLKINLMVCNDNGFHNDTLDLYGAKQRMTFANQACIELGVKDEVVKKDLGKLLLKLEELQAQQIQDTLEPESKEKRLTNKEQDAALQLLNDPHLLKRILSDFNKAGVVGEETNKLVGYLACTSRRLDNPLAVVIQSSSAAGKSSLMDAILNFMPEEERIEYSAMTGQSLFYMGETHLKHKILAIAEEEGASNASYALKLLQSEGEVKIASTGKDAATGNLVTQEYRVEGPTQLFMTTTAIDIDEELMNRCLILSVDEGREQTRLIHQAQRQKRTLQGLQNKREKQHIVELHRNAQRLIKPYTIINPYADDLTFLDDKTRTRRDHEKYLTLIDVIALLHQYQREVKQHDFNGEPQDYIEVTLDDIEQANQLAHEVLGQSLDELPPQTRKMLSALQKTVAQECKKQQMEQQDYRFTRKSLRESMGWSYDQVRVHLDRLIKLEYVLIHRGGRGQSFEYELLYHGEGKNGDAFLMGLIDVKKLTINTMTKSVGGKTPHLGVALGTHMGAVGGTVAGEKNSPKINNYEASSDCDLETLENARLASENIHTSYRNDDPYPLAAHSHQPEIKV